MRNRIQILKEIDKNITYESIRFNNKQISDEVIKSTIEQFFPKLFTHEKWKDMSFFTKALKDEEFYKKIRTMVNIHINIETHLEQIENKLNQNSHCLQELNNKKMTRAALAKRNQLTQQELRKDQIYVRLTPKSQSCLQWMLCNRKFPRIQCKLSCNQHIEYLVNYLSNKWLPGKGHNRIVLYPDVGSYLKNSLPAKERQKVLREPLNNYFMFTDVMVGCGIGQNGIVNLHYDILEKKKDSIRPLPMSESSNVPDKNSTDKKHEQGFQINKKVINLEQMSDSNKKSSSLPQKQDKYQTFLQANHSTLRPSDQQKNLFNPQSKQEVLNNSLNNNHSNHFLSNESNLLNPNRSIYHDDESIFKSIGFFAFGNGTGNSLGFKKNDFNLLSINSNSLMDIEPINPRRHEIKSIEFGKQLGNSSQKKPFQFSNENKGDQENKSHQQKQVEKITTIVKETSKVKGQDLQSSPKQQKTVKNSLLQSPSKQPSIKRQEKGKQNLKGNGVGIEIVEELKEEQNIEVKRHEQKLLDLRNAISFLEEAEGFKGQADQPQEEISQKSGLKEIKTVSIKKKIVN